MQHAAVYRIGRCVPRDRPCGPTEDTQNEARVELKVDDWEMLYGARNEHLTIGISAAVRIGEVFGVEGLLSIEQTHIDGLTLMNMSSSG